MRKPSIPQVPRPTQPRQGFDAAVKETLETITGQRAGRIARGQCQLACEQAHRAGGPLTRRGRHPRGQARLQSPGKPVEVEVESLAQLGEALDCAVGRE